MKLIILAFFFVSGSLATGILVTVLIYVIKHKKLPPFKVSTCVSCCPPPIIEQDLNTKA